MTEHYFEFEKVLESRKYPGARLRRTSFEQKISNTFDIFSGVMLPKTDGHYSKPGSWGLFDIATLFIPYFLLRLMSWGMDTLEAHERAWDNGRWSPEDSTTNFLAGLSLITFPINVAFFIARYLVSAISVLAVSPIIALVHLVVKLTDDADMESNAYHLIGTADSSMKTLGMYLQNKDIENIEATIECQNANYNLCFDTKEKKTISNVGGPKFVVQLPRNPDQTEEYMKKNLYSLFSHNIGNITTKIENSENETIKTYLSL